MKLDLKISDSNTLESFKGQILNFIGQKQNSTYKLNNSVGIKLLTRLRVGLGRLKKHNVNYNFHNSLRPFV